MRIIYLYYECYKKNNLIKTLTFEFALKILNCCDALESIRQYNNNLKSANSLIC